MRTVKTKERLLATKSTQPKELRAMGYTTGYDDNLPKQYNTKHHHRQINLIVDYITIKKYLKPGSQYLRLVLSSFLLLCCIFFYNNKQLIKANTL